MTDMERKTFCAALSRYGAQAQIMMVFEEMAELQDVLCKFLRGRVDGDTLANIAEEIADVGIMLDQMAIEFEVEDAVAELRAFKVRRLRERIENDEYIDRDALRQAVQESQHNNPHPRGMAHIAHDCEHAHFVAMIARFPAADVAPVVRCKNCRSYNKPKTGWCEVHLDREHPDDFCGYGEQKDGGASNG